MKLVLTPHSSVSATHKFASNELVLDWHPAPWSGPPDLQLLQTGANQITLGWSVTRRGQEVNFSYELEMASVAEGVFAPAYTGTATQRLVEHLSCEGAYRFRVRARTPALVSSFSAELVARGCPAASAPERLHVCRRDHGKGTLALAWDANTGSKGRGCPLEAHRVFESMEGGQSRELLGVTTEAEFVPPPSSSPRPYGARRFEVCSGNEQAECGDMAALAANWWEPPKPPALRQVVLAQPSGSAVMLTWDAVVGETLEGELYYAVELAADGSEVFTDALGGYTNLTEVVITGLRLGVAYRFRGTTLRVTASGLPLTPLGGQKWSLPLEVYVGGPPVSEPILAAYPLLKRPEGMAAPALEKITTSYPRDLAIAVTWAPPAELRGRALLAYELWHDSGVGHGFTTSFRFGPSTTRHRFHGLEPGAPYRLRMRARTSGGWSPFSPAAQFVVCGAPSAPKDLRVEWPPHGDPELRWAPPLYSGGSPTPLMAAFIVIIKTYRIWSVEVPNGKTSIFAELPGGQTSFRFDTGNLISKEYSFHVTAVNEEHEGGASNIAYLRLSSLPPAVDLISLVSAGVDWLELQWSEPHGFAPPPDDYEVLWDEGLGGSVNKTVYTGPNASVVIDLPANRTDFRFRARARNTNGWGPLGAISSVPLVLPEAPRDLYADAALSTSDGKVMLRWTTSAPALGDSDASVGRYEVTCIGLDTNVSRTTSSVSPRADIWGLDGAHTYSCSVRACGRIVCGLASTPIVIQGSRRAWGLEAPRREDYAMGVLTINWTSHRDDTAARYSSGYVVKVATSLEGPFEVVAFVDGSARPSYGFNCYASNITTSASAASSGGTAGITTSSANATNITPTIPSQTQAGGAIFHFRVAAASDSGIWEHGYDSPAARHVCAHLPAAPNGPHVVVHRGVSAYEATVTLEVPNLDGASHLGWTLRLTDGTHTEGNYSETRITDVSRQTYTFYGLSGGREYGLLYAAASSAGEGPLSPRARFRTVLRPPAPSDFYIVSSSDDEVQVAWQWPYLESQFEVQRWYVYVDARRAVSRAYPAPEDPSYVTNHTQDTQVTIDCSELGLSRKELYLRVAGVNAAGVGEMSISFRGICSAVPDSPTVPTVEEIGDEYVVLGWTLPDLHGAQLLGVRVWMERLGYSTWTAREAVNFYFGHPNTAGIFNITGSAKTHQHRFAVQAISEVGEGSLSPWLDLHPKLAEPPKAPKSLYVVYSTDSEIQLDWALDRSLERGARTTGWYIYHSIDGTTWATTATEHISTQDVSILTFDCTDATLLGQSRSQSYLWFKVSADSEVGEGPLSTALARRCSAPADAPQGLAWTGSLFDPTRGNGAVDLSWTPPADVHGATLLGYRIYSDEGNQMDSEDHYNLVAAIISHGDVTYRQNNCTLGTTYKYKVVAVTEVGDGTAAELSLAVGLPPVAPPNPFVYRFPVHLRTEPIGKYGGDGPPVDVYPVVDLAVRWDTIDSAWPPNFVSRAEGGLAITEWRTYVSADGVDWPTSPEATVAEPSVASDRELVYLCTYGTFYWFRITAVNAAGESPPSESLRAQCARSPTDTPAPKRVGGDEHSIILQMQHGNLHGSMLLGYNVVYQEALAISATLDGSDWGPEVTVYVPASEHVSPRVKTFFNASGLLQGWPYRFKIKTFSESGVSVLGKWQGQLTIRPSGYITVDDWQLVAYSGSLPSAPGAPLFLNYTNSTNTLGITWSPPNITGGSEFLGYKIWVSSSDGYWQYALPTHTVRNPNVTDYAHVCSSTPVHDPETLPGSYVLKADHFCGNDIANNIDVFPDITDGNCSALCTVNPNCIAYEMKYGNDCYLLAQCDYKTDCWLGTYVMTKVGSLPTQDNEGTFVYFRVAAFTAAGMGPYAESKLFCSARPEAPEVELWAFNNTFVTLRWPVPELYGAPLLGYRVYSNDGLGFDMALVEYISARDVITASATQAWPPQPPYWKAVATAAPNNTAEDRGADVVFTWAPLPRGRHYRLQVAVVTAVSESLNSTPVHAETCNLPYPNVEIQHVPSATSLGLRWGTPGTCEVEHYQVLWEKGVPEVGNYTEDKWILLNEGNESNLLSSFDIFYQADGMDPGAYYRLKLRTHLVSGYRDSRWVVAKAAGVPSSMAPPESLPRYASPTSVSLHWEVPEMNLGEPVGYEVFRNDGPDGIGIISSTPDVTCQGSANPECMGADCSYAPSSKVPQMVGCSITALREGTLYQFRVRALNEFGAGPHSEVVEYQTGGIPHAHAPELSAANLTDCSLTWKWQPALEQSIATKAYEFMVASCSDGKNTTMSHPRSEITMEATVDSSIWDELSPAGTYRAAVRANTTYGFGPWSAWSACHPCVSPPATPSAPWRDLSSSWMAGIVSVAWDAVLNDSTTGGDDPSDGSCVYELWGRPLLPAPGAPWATLYSTPTHDAVTGLAKTANYSVQTYPRTALGTMWSFKVRVRNAVNFSDFSEVRMLSSARLPSEPRSLSLAFNAVGRIRLSWLPPLDSGATSLASYEVRCGSLPWEEVSLLSLAHALASGVPVGPTTCSVRAANSAGHGPAVSEEVLVLQWVP